jgi:hypothetical protein
MSCSLWRKRKIQASNHVRDPIIKILLGSSPGDGARYVIFLLIKDNLPLERKKKRIYINVVF